jgi:hypothetical protein
LEADPEAYGDSLTQGLFADPVVRSAFAQARASAEAQDLQLRLRLLIGPTAGELHGLHWEMLRDPQTNAPLSSDQNLLFSRYLSSLDWRPVRLRPKGELRALAVIANPKNLADYKLAPVDVSGELKRIQENLGGIAVTALAGSDHEGRATLPNLLECLREGNYDLLYLVCHGALIKDEPWLWLEGGRA